VCAFVKSGYKVRRKNSTDNTRRQKIFFVSEHTGNNR
jgi:hypothetical protein